MDKIWLKSYPPGVPHDINPAQYRSVPHMLEESFKKNAARPFSVCMDRWMTYGQLDDLSSAMGAWLQSQGLEPGARVAIISSKMGSLGLRASSSGWLYRASKAAVNSVMKDASLALAGRATVVSFHPGWVRTDMGGAGADIDAATSIAGMRTVLASVKPADTGSFFNYDGQRLDW